MLPSTIYKHTVKTITTPGGRQILAIKASALRTSENGFTGGPTPQASDGSGGGQANRAQNPARSNDLMDFVMLAGWKTPISNDATGSTHCYGRMRDGAREIFLKLPGEAKLAGWPPTDSPARLTVSGEMLTGSDAAMESGGQLNPEHSRWLIGLPPEWGSCVSTAMQSLRPKRQRSSKATLK